MGYDLHITRKENWYDAVPEITLDEWLAYVDGDPEMRHDGVAEAPVGGGKTLRVVGEGICVWTTYSGGDRGRDVSWLAWNRGNIIAKNPDQEIRRKIWAIAQFFGAQIQGDDLELYGEDGEIEKNPSIESGTTSVPTKRSWWRIR
jgi:hypothetical protein